MKLHELTFLDRRHLVVAKDEADARQRGDEIPELRALPFEVREIDEVDGYTIKLKKPKGGDADA